MYTEQPPNLIDSAQFSSRHPRTTRDSAVVIETRKHPHVVSMGLNKAEESGPLPRYWSRQAQVNEDRQRRLCGRWAEFMEADCWAVIRIHPPMATYEAPVPFKG